MLAACRVLVAVSAQSIAAVEDVADLTQVRALVVIASRGSVSLQRAGRGDEHPPDPRPAGCVTGWWRKGLIDRADDPANRRQLDADADRCRAASRPARSCGAAAAAIAADPGPDDARR